MGLGERPSTYSENGDGLPAVEFAIFSHCGEHGDFDMLDDLEELLEIFFAFVDCRCHSVRQIDDLEEEEEEE